jgi:hypothetical protein
LEQAKGNVQVEDFLNLKLGHNPGSLIQAKGGGKNEEKTASVFVPWSGGRINYCVNGNVLFCPEEGEAGLLDPLGTESHL